MRSAEHDSAQQNTANQRKLTAVWRGVIEIGSIMFLFYSNLLMGEFERSNSGHGKSLSYALNDIFTIRNFVVGCVSALIGYLVFEYLRKKL